MKLLKLRFCDSKSAMYQNISLGRINHVEYISSLIFFQFPVFVSTEKKRFYSPIINIVKVHCKK